MYSILTVFSFECDFSSVTGLFRECIEVFREEGDLHPHSGLLRRAIRVDGALLVRHVVDSRDPLALLDLELHVRHLDLATLVVNLNPELQDHGLLKGVHLPVLPF